MDFKLNNIEIPIVVSRIANIHYFELTDKYHTKKASHSFCELLYVDKGKVLVESDNFTGEMSDGQCIVHMTNEMHSFKCVSSFAPNLIIIGFECKSPELVPLAEDATALSDEQKKLLAEVLKEGMGVYAPPYDVPNTLEMKKRDAYPFGADQMIKILLERFLIVLLRAKKVQGVLHEHTRHCDSKVFDVHQYIAENYREKITLDNLCFIFGTNKTTLCRSFKETHGMTVQEYIHHLRMREAKAFLREGKMSITEIAARVGFSSVHYFCRTFKAVTGQSPGKYLESIRLKLGEIE